MKVSPIEMIIDTLCRGNKSEFARRIGLAQPTIMGWIKRGTIDYKRVANSFPDISAEWLLRGEGDMLRSTGGVNGNNNVVGSSHVNYSNSCNEEYYALKGQVELLKELLREKLDK